MAARADTHRDEARPSSTPGSPLLEVRDLAVSYGGVRALRGIDLQVAEGQVVAVLGSNGAGKSTLLRALSGTLGLHRGRIEAGEVHFEGKNLKAATRPAASRPGWCRCPRAAASSAGSPSRRTSGPAAMRQTGREWAGPCPT